MFNRNPEKKNEKSAGDQPVTPPSDAAAPAAAGVEPTEPADATAAETSPAAPETAELAAVKERYMRLLADFDNFRKRQARDREEQLKRANEALLADLLPVIDHLELALGGSPDLGNPFVAGVKLVYDQFLALLDRYGVTPLDAKGQPFDPQWHEALSQMHSATVPANQVLDQYRRGWLLAGRLLRPAQVVVSAGQPDEQQAAAEAAGVSD